MKTAEKTGYSPVTAAHAIGVPLDFFLGIIDRFFNDLLPGYMVKLDESINAGSIPEIRTAAHTLRGAVANLHFHRCVEILEILEKSAVAGSSAPFRKYYSDVEFELALLRKEVSDSIGKKGDPYD